MNESFNQSITQSSSIVGKIENISKVSCDYSTQGRCDVNIRNNRNQTPLQLAVTQGHTELVQLLVAEGADVNMEDEYGDTAMHVALLRPQLANVMLSPSVAAGSAEDGGGGGGGSEGCDLSLHCRVRLAARSINTSATKRTDICFLRLHRIAIG